MTLQNWVLDIYSLGFANRPIRWLHSVHRQEVEVPKVIVIVKSLR